MTCSKCGVENREGRKFCAQCGTPLAAGCPRCGAANEPGEKFCGDCGATLARPAVAAAKKSDDPPIRVAETTAPENLEGERKTVTALFADIKGSTELEQDLDPEEARAIIDPALKLMIEAAHRYDGYVVQSTGDGIFALFGAPVAHEDHPQRALYAALRLQEELRRYSAKVVADGGMPIEGRVGVNTGEVVVRSITTGAGQTEYTPIGHTTNLASRMQAVAPTGSIAISEQARKLVEGYFALKPLGPTRVKGISEPVNVYEVTGLGPLRTRLQRSAGRGLTKFVGREREMDAMRNASELARAGRGQIVAAMAEAGTGKSRLFYEFKVKNQSGWMVLETFSVSHGKASAYFPVIDLLHGYFRIGSEDDARTRREKIGGKVLMLDRALEDTLPYLFGLLGIVDGEDPLSGMDAQVRKRRTLDAIKRIILRESLNLPLMVIFEDLHWIDEETQAFLNLLADSIPNSKILMLVNYRPEYSHQWNSKTYYTQLRLDPLGKESADEMLSALLGVSDLARSVTREDVERVKRETGEGSSLAALKRVIIDKTEGNPFFMEETVQVLLDEGALVREGSATRLTRPIAELKIPPTVQGILAARIDRLPADEKDLLQTLAVIGKEFALSLVRAVVSKSDDELTRMLSNLQLGEFIYEQPAIGDVEYSFKHALTQEVAYNSLLTARRKELHRRTAVAIESVYAARLEDRYTELAHHWTQAGEPLRAATWHVRMARWVRITDLAASRRHWARARALLVPLPWGDERTALLLEAYPELINSLDRLGAEPAESEAVYLEAIAVARQADDRSTEALIEAAYGNLRSSHNDIDGMVEHASVATTLADAEGDLAIKLFARHVLGRGFAWQTRYRESVRTFDESIAIAGSDAAAEIEVLGWRPYIESLGIRGAVLSIMGRPKEGLEFAENFPLLLRQSGIGSDISSAATDRFWPCWMLGDASRAKRYSDEALQLAERYGSDRNIVYALMACGNASTLGLRWEEGNGFLERARQRISSTGAGAEWAVLVYAHQALCLAELGEREQSLDLVRSTRALTIPLARSIGFLRARVMRIVNGAQDLDALELEIAETLEVLHRAEAKAWLPLLLLERAGLARLRGQADGMARDLAEARRLFAEMGVTGWNEYARSIEA
jgi:class 3 adenylate cyclase/tetratricopeptide (TPR) repeat protein